MALDIHDTQTAISRSNDEGPRFVRHLAKLDATAIMVLDDDLLLSTAAELERPRPKSLYQSPPSNGNRAQCIPPLTTVYPLSRWTPSPCSSLRQLRGNAKSCSNARGI